MASVRPGSQAENLADIQVPAGGIVPLRAPGRLASRGDFVLSVNGSRG